MNRGMWYALGAYLAWGLLPVYWRLLHTVPPLQIAAHRMIWSFVLLAVALAYLRRWRWLDAARQPRTLLIFSATGALLLLNWLAYIWAVNAGFIVETSLGYFINPLVNVLLAVIFLRERMRLGQWVAMAMATAGVLYLTVAYGSLPWIALILAFTFGFYGLLKKQAPLHAMEGLTLEMGLMIVPTGLYLLYLEATGAGSFWYPDSMTNVLLVFSGVVTAVPLALFAAGARRVPLITIGILQYIAPTLQFLIGVYIYDEPFDRTRWLGFSIIWLALIVYTAEGMLTRWHAMPRRVKVGPASDTAPTADLTP